LSILKECVFVTDLAAVTALGATIAREVTFGALTLRENDGLALASLALRTGAARPSPMGLDLPEPGCCCASQGLAAFWMAPGQWMIEAEGRAQEDFAKEVLPYADGCSVTEQTDGWVCFEISSAAGAVPIYNLLEKMVNIDLSAFPPGRATRTCFEHIAVFVIRRAEDRVAMIAMRSAALSLWHAVATAAARMT
jgi:heterotetrameric sarcosine oxidase gamma subunit